MLDRGRDLQHYKEGQANFMCIIYFIKQRRIDKSSHTLRDLHNDALPKTAQMAFQFLHAFVQGVIARLGDKDQTFIDLVNVAVDFLIENEGDEEILDLFSSNVELLHDVEKTLVGRGKSLKRIRGRGRITAGDGRTFATYGIPILVYGLHSLIITCVRIFFKTSSIYCLMNGSSMIVALLSFRIF